MEESLIGYLCSVNLLLTSQKFCGDVVGASVDLENRRKIYFIVKLPNEMHNKVNRALAVSNSLTTKELHSPYSAIILLWRKC